MQIFPTNLGKVTPPSAIFVNFRENLKMRLKSGYSIREIAGEKMILMRAGNSTDMTKAVMLNATSEFLWNSLQDKVFNEDDVTKLLTGRYSVELERAGDDAFRWVSSMINAGLIEN